MGTSSIFRGNNDRNPLLPLGYEEESQKTVHQVTWKTVKTDMSKYISSGGLHGNARHIIRQAIKANGGAHRMVASSSSSMRAAQGLVRFFVDVGVSGVYTTFKQLGIQYEGKSVKDVFSHLINSLSPKAITKEDIVARQALEAALCKLCEYVTDNDMDFSCIDNMSIEVMDLAMKSFLIEYIWATVMKDLECRVEQYMSDVTTACEREKELKDIIEAVVDVEYDNNESLMKNNVNEAVLALTERCLSILEGIV